MNLRRIDLFSSKFNFNADGNFIQKGTYLGSFYTIIVVSLILSYLFYICEQYANNQIEPVYRSQNIINNSTQKIDLEQNIFAYKITNRLLDSQTYPEYVQFQVYGIFSNGTSILQVRLSSQQCSDNNIQDYACINSQYIDESILWGIEAFNYILSEINIQVVSCNDDFASNNHQNCADQKDVDDFMNDAYIQLKLQVKQFNIQSRSMESTFQTVTIYTSSDQYKTTNIDLQNQQIQVKQGLFIQNKQIYNAPGKFQVGNQNLNRQFVIQNFGSSPYSFIVIKVDQITQQISIQFPTIPQILALVNSVANILMFFGIFLRYLSQLDLKKDFFMIILQNIYQSTYQDILKINQLCEPIEKLNEDQQNRIQENIFKGLIDKTQSQKYEKQNIKKECFDKENQETEQANKDDSIFIEIVDVKNKIKKMSLKNHGKNEESQLSQECQQSHYIGPKLSYSINMQENQISSHVLNISKQNQKQLNVTAAEIESQKKNLQELIQADQQTFVKFEYISKINQSQETQIEKLKMGKDKTLASKIKKIIFNFMVFNKKKYLSSKGLLPQHQKKIYKQIDQDLNISQFYQEIIFLKKAIMILLTQDQLASIQLIGCSQNFLNLNIDQSDAQSILESSQGLNYYERQLAITQSQNLQGQYVQQFLKRCSSHDKSENINEVDKRILESISKCYLN
ncbi:AMP-binding enzyme family protein (macronuclear) [Tetrahymena thermophila SB210]|uniref:AMP-binding enzyme family protein n=1 Tax=Tetrahymena thermophila (strain SB210) TaxID=312017 RepID=I7LY11_TETTS|nr:AMP-binding enzyme family protein [Tetrahymena thermophila SB210]EAS07151.2 AMP-binding enzyme family protein [Tetrahymena thermophila SB210]|eukprot:XP_001027393.2 AMP-binding enzyme family protein [Tetrahymena thermophila SB210]